MSTTYENQLMLGYEFSDQELISFMKVFNSEIWDEEFFEDNEGYKAMIAETFAEYYELSALYREDYRQEHLIGFKLDEGLDYVEAINLINSLSVKIMEIFNLNKKPSLYSGIFSY